MSVRATLVSMVVSARILSMDSAALAPQVIIVFYQYSRYALSHHHHQLFTGFEAGSCPSFSFIEIICLWVTLNLFLTGLMPCSHESAVCAQLYEKLSHFKKGSSFGGASFPSPSTSPSVWVCLPLA